MKISLLALACITSLNMHSADTLKELVDRGVRAQAQALYSEYMGEVVKKDELEQRIADSIDTTGSEDARLIKASLSFNETCVPERLVLNEQLGYCANTYGKIYKAPYYKFDDLDLDWRENSASRELPKIKARNILLEQVSHVSGVKIVAKQKPVAMPEVTDEMSDEEVRKVLTERHAATKMHLTRPVVWEKWNPEELPIAKLKQRYSDGTPKYDYRIEPIKSEGSDEITAALCLIGRGKFTPQ